MKNYEFEGLLIKAVEFSNLEIIVIILEFNHSVEFIIQIGQFGTALFEAIRSIELLQNKNLFYSYEKFMKSRTK